MVVPEQWGGAAMDYVSLALTLEEIAAGDGATSTIVAVQNSVVCGPILAFGNDAQKETYLKPLARGEWLGCFCLTEPHVGSDASAIATRAERRGDAYVLNGVKQFITTGKNAGLRQSYSRSPTRRQARKASRRSSSTRARRGTPSRGSRTSSGQHASDTAQIVFENCEVPAANLLGAEGGGYRIALANLEAGRIGIAAPGGRHGAAALEHALAYAARARGVRQAYCRAPGVNFRTGRHGRCRSRAARQLVWHAASLRDAGEPCLKEASMAKLFATEMAERVCSDAIQIHGG
jgi:alkylation response protein AidB-like acyl-CoA dehydrogenase